MKVLVLNSLRVDDKYAVMIRQFLNTKLQEDVYKLKWIDLDDKKIEYCNGCGYCGTKDPGICAKQDDMIDIFPEMANSELQILLSDISFGGYSSDLKKVLDRYSPLGLTTYTVHKGELHHSPRYPLPFIHMSIGIQKDHNIKQEKTFKLVGERMATASFADKHSTVVFSKGSDDSQLTKQLEKELKEMGLIS